MRGQALVFPGLAHIDIRGRKFPSDKGTPTLVLHTQHSGWHWH